MATVNREKTIMLNAIMSNSGMQKTIKDAFKAPPGSTRRKKAAKMLRSMGMGATMPVMGGMMPMDGKGGAGDQNPFYQGINNQQANVQPNFGNTNPINISSNVGSSRTANITPMIADPRELRGGSTFIFPSASAKKQGTETVDSTGASVNTTDNPIDLGINIGDSWSANTTPMMYGGDSSYTQHEGVGSSLGGEQKYIETSSGGKSSFNVDKLIQDLMNTNDPYSVSTEDMSEFQKLVSKAASDGVGAFTFYTQIANDNEKLNLLEDTYGLSRNSLPRGSIFAESLPELRSTMRKEQGLDAQYEVLQKLREEGAKIEDSIALSTTRDELIESYDRQIEDTKSKLSTTENIFKRSRMKQYLNFLYIRQGKEQQRYSEYLKRGVDDFNDRLKSYEDRYNDKKQEFEILYSEAKLGKKEGFDSLQKMLTEMYEMHTNYEEEYNKKQDRDRKILNENMSILNNIIELKDTMDGDKITAGGEKFPETGDTFVDTINYLVKLRDQGMLNDFNYREQINSLMKGGGYEENGRGEVESLVNKSMEEGFKLFNYDNELDNVASDFLMFNE